MMSMLAKVEERHRAERKEKMQHEVEETKHAMRSLEEQKEHEILERKRAIEEAEKKKDFFYVEPSVEELPPPASNQSPAKRPMSPAAGDRGGAAHVSELSGRRFDAEVRRIAHELDMDEMETYRVAREFLAADSDKSGEINWSEFMPAVHRLLKLTDPSDLPEKRVEDFFRYTDVDQSGYVSLYEFVRMMRDYFQAGKDAKKHVQSPRTKLAEARANARKTGADKEQVLGRAPTIERFGCVHVDRGMDMAKVEEIAHWHDKQ